MPPCRRHGVGIVYGYHTRAVYCYRNGLDFGERPGEYGSVLQGCAGVRLHRLAGRRPGVDEWRGQRQDRRVGEWRSGCGEERGCAYAPGSREEPACVAPASRWLVGKDGSGRCDARGRGPARLGCAVDASSPGCWEEPRASHRPAGGWSGKLEVAGATHAGAAGPGNAVLFTPRRLVVAGTACVAPASGWLGGKDGSGRCRSEEHTSELQSRTQISYAVFCLKK